MAASGSIDVLVSMYSSVVAVLTVQSIIFSRHSYSYLQPELTVIDADSVQMFTNILLSTAA
jgi:hypothetical protein